MEVVSSSIGVGRGSERIGEREDRVSVSDQMKKRGRDIEWRHGPQWHVVQPQKKQANVSHIDKITKLFLTLHAS